MLLKLHYNESVCHETRAAFIRGSASEDWLTEINRWDIAVPHLECYLLPESIHSVQPAGLFVIFKGEKTPGQVGLFEPYGVIGDTLYLPIRAGLTPEVSPEELRDQLLWERQLFHPIIGLVGFSVADQLSLADLLDYAEPAGTDWKWAHRGISAKPGLGKINVLQPTLEEVMDSFKEMIDPKALQDIMGGQEDKNSLVRDLFTNLNQGLLNGALSVIQKIKEAWPNGNAADTGRGGESNTPQGPGLFDRLENWIRENLEELQRKRENEIQRLLHLFDQNTDEALKYAIPLDSPYLNRGTATPSSRLPQHPADFDLGKLGGGGAVDSWHLDAHYYDLRRKYQAAAQKEIAAGNFKKAAYIYAHLLGDFYAAARVLEQGKHYREAAALYKDHLQNIPAAAECLERGGLLLEAIPLYGQLQKHEKVGDLYQTIGQTGQAEKYYEQSVETVLRSSDYLNAARILTDKLAQPDRSKQILLEGWDGSNQSETCLIRYFELMAKNADNPLSRQVQEIFVHRTPAAKRAQFLNVLVHLNEEYGDPQLLHTSTAVAYQIISEQLSEGNLTQLPTLKKFLPDDYLLSSDVSRFTSLQRVQPRHASSSTVLQLDQTIRWLNAISHRNQFLALGVKEGRLHLARGNWYGNFEYYAWSDRVDSSDSWGLIADPYYSNQVVLLAADGVAPEEKILPKNKYFDEELVVDGSLGSSKGLLGLAMNPEGGVSMLKAHNYTMTLYHYYKDGSLKNSVDCKFASERPLRLAPSTTPAHSPTGMLYRNGHYYAFRGNILMKISEDGSAEIVNVHTAINRMAASMHHTKLKIAILTENGCLLLRHLQGELRTGSDFFAQDSRPVTIQFLSANHLVVTGKQEAWVYHIGEDRVQAQSPIRTRSAIVATLPTANRHQWALLEETGRISMVAIENE